MKKQASLTGKATIASVFNVLNPLSSLYGGETWAPEWVRNSGYGSLETETAYKSVAGLLGAGSLAALIRYIQAERSRGKHTASASHPASSAMLDQTFASPLSTGESAVPLKKISNLWMAAAPTAAVATGAVLGYGLMDRHTETTDLAELSEADAAQSALLRRIARARALASRGQLSDEQMKKITADFEKFEQTHSGLPKIASLKDESDANTLSVLYSDKDRSTGTRILDAGAGLLGLGVLVSVIGSGYLVKNYMDANSEAKKSLKEQKKRLQERAALRVKRSDLVPVGVPAEATMMTGKNPYLASSVPLLSAGLPAELPSGEVPLAPSVTPLSRQEAFV